MNGNYNLFVINSRDSINKIFNFLKIHANSEKEIVCLRKHYLRDSVTKKYKEHSQRFAILDVKLYERLCLLKLDKTEKKIDIIPYVIPREDYSYKNSSVMHFYFPLDNKNKNIDEMKKKLKFLSSTQIIYLDDWFVHEEGICEFSDKVSDETKITIKIMLDNPLIFRVSWCRINMFKTITRKFT